MATHAWTHSTEPDPDTGVRREVPLTAANAASFNTIWEADLGRFGIEVYYTGRQPLEDNPYRFEGDRYWLAGFFAERRFGPSARCSSTSRTCSTSGRPRTTR